jgi:chlorobenzene dioxygenase small subunit/benzene/toluene dioxygenase beta subunit
MSDAKPSTVDNGLFVEIQRFLYREAGLLDRRDYAGWLSLLADDIQYRVTAAVARDAGATAVDYAIIDEDKAGLKSRVDQISNPRLTRAENPPSMVRRVVSNIEAFHSDKQDEFSVVSYLLAYRSRPSAPEGGFYVVARHDTLRRSRTDWLLARRNAQLDHTLLYDGALSTLL